MENFNFLPNRFRSRLDSLFDGFGSILFVEGAKRYGRGFTKITIWGHLFLYFRIVGLCLVVKSKLYWNIWSPSEQGKMKFIENPSFNQTEKFLFVLSISSEDRGKVLSIIKSFYYLARTNWEVLNGNLFLGLWFNFCRRLSNEIRQFLLFVSTMFTHYFEKKAKYWKFLGFLFRDEYAEEINIIHRPLKESEMNPILFILHIFAVLPPE